MSHFFKKTKLSGFTLIELLVSIGIMVLILTVVGFGQRGYTEGATLLNAADEMALNVSRAQAYGIAVKQTSPGSSNFQSGYGISITRLESGGDKAYVSFLDSNSNSRYDGDLSCGAAECLEKNILTRGNYIDSFCVVRTNGNDQCNSASRVDISFKRPETKAELKFFNSGGQEFNPSNVKGAKIILRSPGGLTRTVVVYTTGQVAVE